MTKQTKFFVGIIGIVFLLIVGILGEKYMEHKKAADRKAEQAQLVDAKKEVALYIVQHYEGVEKIQFGDLKKNKVTGSWSLGAKVNDSNLISIHIRDEDNIPGSIGQGTDRETFKLKERLDPKATLNHVEVIYKGAFQ